MNNKPDEIENLLHDEDLGKVAGGRRDNPIRPEVVQEYFNKYVQKVRMGNKQDFAGILCELHNEPITADECIEISNMIVKKCEIFSLR